MNQVQSLVTTVVTDPTFLNRDGSLFYLSFPVQLRTKHAKLVVPRKM